MEPDWYASRSSVHDHDPQWWWEEEDFGPPTDLYDVQ
jgi:hypothetical protein